MLCSIWSIRFKEILIDNIILKCRYYKHNSQYKENDRNLKHREFVSCQNSYSYLNYVQTGATENAPKDYEQYIGNREKSCGVFNEKGLLSEEQRKELRHQLQNTESVIWDIVISFRTEFGDSYCRDYEQAYNFLVKELPKFFKKCGLNSSNIVWYAGLHENTENKHIHLSFFEKEPKYFANGGKLKYHSGKLPKDVLIDSKFIFEKALTNPTAQLLKDRKDLYDRINVSLDKRTVSKKAKRLLLELYRELPKDGRIGYASENMDNVRKKVDDVTDYFLMRNKQIQESYITFKKDCICLETWKISRGFEKESSYMKDMKRRLGNLIIFAALDVGHIHDEIEKLSIKTANYKAYKKKLRDKEWNKILNLWKQTTYEHQQEMDFFMSFHEKLERYSKQQKYEMVRSRRNRDFEM